MSEANTAVSEIDASTDESPVRTMFANDRATQMLGIEVVEIGEGTTTARVRVDADMVNGHGVAHGGYVFLLADTAFAGACNSHGPVTVASGAEITFVASARLDDVLVAEARERTHYGRNGIYDVTVYREPAAPGEERVVIAEFRGRSRTIER